MTGSWDAPENSSWDQEAFVQSDTVPQQTWPGSEFLPELQEDLLDVFTRRQRTDVRGLQGNIVADLEEREEPVEC